MPRTTRTRPPASTPAVVTRPTAGTASPSKPPEKVTAAKDYYLEIDGLVSPRDPASGVS